MVNADDLIIHDLLSTIETHYHCMVVQPRSMCKIKIYKTFERKTYFELQRNLD